jgi:osmotically-inducible protein OsmY
LVIPVSAVERLSEETVFVKVSGEELEELPRYVPRDEEGILTELQDRLKGSSLDLSDVKATVEEHVAQLEGVVSDVAAKRRAEATAWSVDGVIDVKNVLDTDTAIVARVTAALADDPRTEMAVIEVISERGLVTLKGEVDSAKVRDAAEKIAAELPGVVSVVNALEVEPDDDTEALKPLPREAASSAYEPAPVKPLRP